MEILGIKFPEVIQTEIDHLVNEKTERVLIALEHKTSVMLSIRFLENRSNDDKGGHNSFESSTSIINPQDESLTWEKWEIGFKIHSITNSYPNNLHQHHLAFNPIDLSNPTPESPSEGHLKSAKSNLQLQLQRFRTQLIEFVLNERNHIPEITNSDLLPFPMDISILPVSNG